MPVSMPAKHPGRAVGVSLAPLVVVIESDPEPRAEMRRLLGEWGLRVGELDLDATMPVQDEHLAAAAIVAAYDLGPSADGTRSVSGLDLALLIARRALRIVPTLVICGDYGRVAIPACSAHRIPVFFKPLVPAHLLKWLRSVSAVAQALAQASGRNAA